MSDLKINHVTNKSGETGPIIAGVSTVSASFMVMPSGDIATRGSGSGRAVVVLGATPSVVDTMDYFDTASTGNAVDFGDARAARYENGFSGMASGTRGCFHAGSSPVPAAIEYVTMSSNGSSHDFGDHRRGITNGAGQCANGTRGLIAGGYLAPSYQYTIDFITIATTGNSEEFGEFSNQDTGNHAPMTTPTRAVFGNAGGNLNYINYASGGGTEIFGDMRGDSRTGHITGCSSQTRGIMSAGEAPSRVNIITYVTLATLGNPIDFGDLLAARNDSDAVSSQTRGFIVAGANPSTTNSIEFITIATTGNAQDFGDLTQARGQPSAFSDVHGGLG